MVEALGSSDKSRLLVGDERIELTKEMADVLSAVARATKQGLAVSVVPQNTRNVGTGDGRFPWNLGVDSCEDA